MKDRNHILVTHGYYGRSRENGPAPTDCRATPVYRFTEPNKHVVANAILVVSCISLIAYAIVTTAF